MEIASGIHKIERVGGANSYLVLAGDIAAVVDTGMPGNERKILDYARSVGVEPGKLQYIALTHSDIDHSGSAAKLKALTSAKLEIHEADAPRLSGETKLKETKGAVGILFGVMTPFMRFTPVKADVLLKDSDRVLDMVVIHTPGHTDGSICLYKEGKAIFVGDALRTDSARGPRLPPSAMTADMELAKDSVRKISTYQYDLLLPGHGPPITKDASKVMMDFVQRGFQVK